MNLKKLLPTFYVQKKYADYGMKFADAVSYLYATGETPEFVSLFEKWSEWEKEHSRRGYRTTSLDAFIYFIEHNLPAKKLVNYKRVDEEEIKLHSEIYRQNFLGKVKPMIDLEKMIQDGKPQFGTWTVPSTEKPEDYFTVDENS